MLRKNSVSRAFGGRDLDKFLPRAGRGGSRPIEFRLEEILGRALTTQALFSRVIDPPKDKFRLNRARLFRIWNPQTRLHGDRRAGP